MTITDAIADGAWLDKVSFEIGTKSGFKNSELKKETVNEKGEVVKGKKDTSLFNTEQVGEHDYIAKMNLDLAELQFISTDIVYDRCAADLSQKQNKDMYLNAIRRNFNMLDVDINFYRLLTAVCGDEFAEEGIKLSTEGVDIMVKKVLSNIVNVKEVRPSKGGIFEFKSMELIVKMEDGSEETVIINNNYDINNVTFEYADAYVVADTEEVVKRNKILLEAKNSKKSSKAKDTDNE